MSTRAQILILDKNIDYKNSYKYPQELIHYCYCLFYIHCDGYPEGLGKDLEDYIKSNGAQTRLNDVEYLSANILPYLKDTTRKDMEKEHDYTGFGISKEIHGDIEYLYIINLHDYKIICVDMWEHEVLYEKNIKNINEE